MSLLNWFRKKHPQNNHTFTDEEREYSKEIREKKREIELLKIERESELHKLKIEKQKLELQQEINELRNLYDDDDDDGTTDLESDSSSELIKMFAPYFLKNLKPSSEPLIQTISKIDIENLWKNTPESMKNHAKTQTDEDLKRYLKTQLPNIDDESIKYAISLIRK